MVDEHLTVDTNYRISLSIKSLDVKYIACDILLMSIEKNNLLSRSRSKFIYKCIQKVFGIDALEIKPYSYLSPHLQVFFMSLLI